MAQVFGKFCRNRGEEAVASVSVVEVERTGGFSVRKKDPKLRVLVLSSDTSKKTGGSLYLFADSVTAAKDVSGQEKALRQTIDVRQVSSHTWSKTAMSGGGANANASGGANGKTAASTEKLNAVDGGLEVSFLDGELTVAFESVAQRDMFLNALRRVARSASRGDGGDLGTVPGDVGGDPSLKGASKRDADDDAEAIHQRFRVEDLQIGSVEELRKGLKRRINAGGPAGAGTAGGGPYSATSVSGLLALDDAAAIAAEISRGISGGVGVALSAQDEAMLNRLVASRKLDPNRVQLYEKNLNQEARSTHQQIVSSILKEDAMWRERVNTIEKMQAQVGQLEVRVNKYAAELMARRSIIEDIEQESTGRKRRKDNLSSLLRQMHRVQEWLALDSASQSALSELSQQETLDEVSNFFMNPQKRTQVINAMLRFEEIREGKSNQREYAILGAAATSLRAVAERSVEFQQFQFMVAGKVGKYLQVLIQGTMQGIHLCRERVSRRGYLVLAPLVGGLHQFAQVAPLLRALCQCHPVEHQAFIRALTRELRSIYCRDVKLFFAELRRQLTRPGWRGAPTLGAVLVRSELRYFFKRQEWIPNTMYKANLIEGGNDSDDDAKQQKKQKNGKDEDASSPLEIYLSPTDETGVKVLKSGTYLLHPADPLSSAPGVTGGLLRPDLAFAIALKAVIDLVVSHGKFIQTECSVKSKPRQLVTASNFDSTKESSEIRQVDTFLNDAEYNTGGPNSGSSDSGNSDSSGKGDSDDDGADSLGASDEENEEVITEVLDPLTLVLWETFTSETQTKILYDKPIFHLELLKTIKTIANECDGIYLFPILSQIDIFLDALDDGDLYSSAALSPEKLQLLRRVNAEGNRPPRTGFVTAALSDCREAVVKALRVYTGKQIESIRASASASGISDGYGLLPCFAVLPVLANRLETLLSVLNSSPSNIHIAAFLHRAASQGFASLDALTKTVIAENDHRISSQDPLPAAVGRVYFRQYLHHSFFVAFSEAGVGGEVARGISDTAASCRAKLPRVESTYLSRVLFQDCFPIFSRFILVAEDVLATYEKPEDVSAHGALRQDRVAFVTQTLPGEVNEGIPSALKKLKSHLRAAVPNEAPVNDAFFKSFAAVAAQKLASFVSAKVGVMTKLLQACYPKITPSIQEKEVASLFSKFSSK